MRNFRSSPEVNAGSMADIAFLLLIFFLVSTTIPKDKGIARILPQLCPVGEPCSIDINERNILLVAVNEVGDLLVNKELTEYKDLQKKVIDFIDNNGANSCNYCEGAKSTEASDHPNLAAISIDAQATTPYKYFITIQDEITKSYVILRTKYAMNAFNKTLEELTEVELKEVKEAYPYRISEANIQ